MSQYYRPNISGRTQMWCAFCDRWFNYGEDWDGTCPQCGMSIDRFKCSRCGREWTSPRWREGRKLPETCPRCKTPYWNRERMRDPLTGQWYEGFGPKAAAERRRRQREGSQ